MTRILLPIIAILISTAVGVSTAGAADDVELLRLNLGYTVSFVEELGIDLDLSDFVDLGPDFGDVVRLAGSAGLFSVHRYYNYLRSLGFSVAKDTLHALLGHG